jgi:hypothetical protein
LKKSLEKSRAKEITGKGVLSGPKRVLKVKVMEEEGFFKSFVDSNVTSL